MASLKRLMAPIEKTPLAELDKDIERLENELTRLRALRDLIGRAKEIGGEPSGGPKLTQRQQIVSFLKAAPRVRRPWRLPKPWGSSGPTCSQP